MEKKGKALIVAILGFLIIIAVLIASAGNNRGGNPSDTGGNPSSAGGSAAAGTGETADMAGNREKAKENSTEAQSGTNLENYMREQDTIMADMMRDMEDIPKTGSADIDFLNGMIPHHESAVAMAESFLKNGGQDQKLITLAGDIIEVQNKEIDQMKTMIERLEKSGKRNEEKEEAYLKEYQKMFAAHQMDHVTENSHAAMDHVTESSHAAMDHMAGGAHGGAGTSGTVDEAFAEGMILHHQMAVDMAEAILEYTQDDEVEALAREIIEAQEKEIGEMQEILNNLSPM